MEDIVIIDALTKEGQDPNHIDPIIDKPIIHIQRNIDCIKNDVRDIRSDIRDILNILNDKNKKSSWYIYPQ